jgi:hypothetical protein
MRGDPPITREVVNHQSQLAGGRVKQRWEALADEKKDAYVKRLATNAQEPPELLALIAHDPAAKERWSTAHVLVRAEFCAFINEARFPWQRRWRAKTALKAAPKETPYRADAPR